jgi:hypothetical protein
MRGTNPSREPDSAGPESPDGHRPLLVIIGAAVAVALVIVTTLLLVGDEGATPPSPGPAATPTTSNGDSATPSPTQEPSTSSTQEPSSSPSDEPTQPASSAAEALGPFFAAAATLDQQLTTAAAAINATGPPWEEITGDVARTVRAADLRPVSRAIPAGLSHDLQQSVILVLSDLASRRYAMQGFATAGPVDPDDVNSDRTNAQLLADLQNGHAAAARFDGDLAAARALAAAGAPVPQVPTRSRLTAEALVLAEYVRVANAGCNARGGAVLTELPQLEWRDIPGSPDAEGTVDGVAFNADLRASGTWEVYLFAC